MGMDAWYEADFPQRNWRGAMRSPIPIKSKKSLAEKSSIKLSGAYDNRGCNSSGWELRFPEGHLGLLLTNENVTVMDENADYQKGIWGQPS